MSTAQFQVVFDGPAVTGGEIDVRELTASLAAMNQLFEEADSLLNGGRTTHALKVRGSFKTGSFKVLFVTQQSPLDTARQWLLGDDASAISNASAVADLLVLGGGVASGTALSLFGLLKWLKGRRVTKILETDDKTFKVFSGDQFIKAEERVIRLFNDYKVRRAFEAAIAEPLKAGKIDSIAFTDDAGKSFVEATAEEKSYFSSLPEQSTPLTTQRFEMNVSIVRLSFESNKWMVFDGQHTLHVAIEDASFNRRIEENEEVFSKGDILRVTMRFDQSETSNGLKTEHTIEAVHEHRRPMYRGQMSLPVDQDQKGTTRKATIKASPAKTKSKSKHKKKKR